MFPTMPFGRGAVFDVEPPRMGFRRSIAGLAVVATLVTPQVTARATSTPFLAEAGFGVMGNAHVGYVLRFMVRRGFVTSTSPIDLVSEVSRCSLTTGECELVAQQVDLLVEREFVARSDGSALLRTRWAGKPLVIEWKRGGFDRGATTGHSMTFVGTNHTEEMIEYRALWSRASARALLGGGRDCSSTIATTVIAVQALAQNVLMGVNDLPRAERVAGLATSRGRCYRTV